MLWAVVACRARTPCYTAYMSPTGVIIYRALPHSCIQPLTGPLPGWQQLLAPPLFATGSVHPLCPSGPYAMSHACSMQPCTCCYASPACVMAFLHNCLSALSMSVCNLICEALVHPGCVQCDLGPTAKHWTNAMLTKGSSISISL